MPGPAELAIIAVIVIVVFGVGKLGDIGGALGRGIREFRQEVDHSRDNGQLEDHEPKV